MVDMDEVLTGDNFLKFLEIYLGKKLPDCYKKCMQNLRMKLNENYMR